MILNNQEHSAAQISRILPKYGMELKKTQICRIVNEIRNTFPDIYVRINGKHTGGKLREAGKWYNIILKLKKAIVEYAELTGFKPSLRTMQYQFIDEKIITEAEKNHFQTNATRARLGFKDQNGKLFLPKLDIDCFAEDNTREMIGDYDGDVEPEETEQPGDIPDAVKTIDDLIAILRKAPEDYAGKAPEGIKGKRGGRWFGQPEYVEVWVEKNDLLEGIGKILENKHVRIRGNGGFASLDWLRQGAAIFEDIIKTKGLKAENIHIIYLGDMDPSGEIMDDYMWRRLRLPEFDLPQNINLPKRIAILQEQIEKYNFPLLNIEKKADKKKANSSLKEFERKNKDKKTGITKATHLNAFFTKEHFKEFEKILLAAVDEYWYEEIYDTMIETYEVEPEEPESLTEDVLKEKRLEMYRKITKAFTSGWYRGLPDAPDYW